MDDFMSSDEVLCYKDAVAFLKVSGRKPNSAIVYRTIRRFVEDQVGLYRKKVSKFLLYVQLFFFAFIYLLCPRNDKRLESVAMYDNRCEEIA